MEPGKQPSLWARDLDAIVDMAIEQGLSFPLSITLTAPDGSVCGGELEQRESSLSPQRITACAEQWDLQLSIIVVIFDRHRRSFEAMLVGAATEPSGQC